MWLQRKGFLYSFLIGLISGSILATFVHLINLGNSFFPLLVCLTIILCCLGIGYLSEKIETYRRLKLIGLGVLFVILAAIVQGLYMNFYDLSGKSQFFDKEISQSYTFLIDGILLGLFGVAVFSYMIFPIMIICVLIIEKLTRKSQT